MTRSVTYTRIRYFSDDAYHSFGHAFANTRTTASAEEDLALENVLLEHCRGIRGWGLDVGLRHGYSLQLLDRGVVLRLNTEQVVSWRLLYCTAARW